MKRIALLLAAGALLALSAPAFADDHGRHRRHDGHRGYQHHYQHNHHVRVHRHRPARHFKRRHRRVHRRHTSFSLVIGLPPPRPHYYRYAPTYYAPPAPAAGGCLATTGTGYVDGRLAQFAGTMCYDRYGRGYIVPGSQRFVGYLR